MKRNNITKALICILTIAMLMISGCTKKPDEDPTRAWGGFTSSSVQTASWNLGSNVGKMDTTTVTGAREKFTKIKGNGQDTITILVFMCGSDLESRSSMASYDLQEMATSTISDKINLLVYTGGCSRWHIDGISNSVNQIYRVVGNGNIERLVDNAGSGAMVDPATLTSFIEWGVDNYEADRYELIFWDHGGGSVSGYGHDEKYSGSMGLAKIDQALTDADVQFDFIGFDCCLMGNTETALMLTKHADYLIASEESEPGIGWYYTNWLTKLSANTSMPTVEIGKNICDDIVSVCAKQVPSQSATLSVVDLAEMEYTVPKLLSEFSKSSINLLNNQQYNTIAKARSGSREFASSSKVDLVDLVDMASRLGTNEGKALADALLSCVKYNNTSRDMANSYGLSIYFPYRSKSYVKTVLNTYDQIDMNEEYVDYVNRFVTYQASGQVTSGGNTTPYSSISGNYSSQSYSNQSNVDDLSNLLGLFFGQDTSMTQSSSYSPYFTLLDFLFTAATGGRDNIDDIARFISENHFDADLNWKKGKIAMTNEQWEMIDELVLNVYVDDGTGYIEMGRDNTYSVDEQGNLLEEGGDTWLALSTDEENWTVVPYYYVNEIRDGEDVYTINGRIPALVNGEKAELWLQFTNEEPNGKVIGYTYSYDDGMAGKTAEVLEEGDELTFICDFYSYDGEYVDSYPLNDKIVYNGKLSIGDIDISDYKTLACYQITDIYQQNYWTALIGK